MLNITPGAAFNVVMYARTARSHMLYVFYNVSTCAHVRCIEAASTDDPIIATLNETSPVAAVPLSGEVVLSPTGQWFLSVYAQDSATDLDETSITARELIHITSVMVAVDCCVTTSYAETNGCEPVTVNINTVEVATPAAGTTLDIDVVDQDGNPIGSLVSGQWVVTIPEEVDNILPYANRIAALADTATIPATNQYVVINDTGRLFHGNGASTVAALVADPQVMLMPVREDGALFVTVEGTEYKLQLNA